MPNYQYRCKCGTESEVFHAMDAKPDVSCQDCGNPMKKAITSFFMGSGSTLAARRGREKVERRKDMSAELRENHNVHEVGPVGKNTFEDAYSDIKKSGSLTKDRMDATIEMNKRKREAKEKAKREDYAHKKMLSKRMDIIKKKQVKKKAEERTIRL